MYENTSLATQFRPYCGLLKKTIRRTLERMWLPLPVGMESQLKGVRSALLEDPQLHGTIESEVVAKFARAVEENKIAPERAEGWVRRVTRRKTRDCAEVLVRALAPEVSLYGEEGEFLDHLLPCDNTPEACLVCVQDGQWLVALLNPLNPEDQALLRAQIIDGYSYEELAADFGSTPAALRQRVKRLLDLLRKQARKLGEFDLCA
jgi:DNA-directed RNA polymerase specialized sigma24 family protein